MSGIAAFAPRLPPPCGTAVASVGTTDRLRNPAQKRCLRWRLLGRLLGAAPAMLGLFSPRKYAKTG